jgi:2-oxoglutarate ferredoxin oxidoreductase subunit delta
MARGTVQIDEERCKGCGLCIAACPQHILAFSGRLNQSSYDVACVEKPENCMGCAFCALTCPDVAIRVFQEKPAS